MKAIASVAGIGFLSVSSAVFAAEMAPKGQNYLFCETNTLELGEGHSLTHFRAKGFSTAVNPPLRAECYGTIENMPDKTFKANGYCVHTDQDGDKVLDRWWADNTMPKGKWEDTGLTGKWKGFRSTGTYVYTDFSTKSECKGVSNWEQDK